VPAEVAEVVVPPGDSVEANARYARYAALDAVARRLSADRIAVGHTADDQAETVLMRIMSRSRVRGLAGIPAVRGRIIRPLLGLRRAALQDVLKDAGLGWLDDPSNRDTRFLRNRVRHEVLPRLASSPGRDVVDDLNRVAARCRQAVDRLEALGAQELERLAVTGGNSLTLPRRVLAALPEPLAGEVLRQALARLGAVGPFRAWVHRGLARVTRTPSPRPFQVGPVRIEVSGRLVRVAHSEVPRLPTRPVPVPGRVSLPEAGVVLESRLVAALGYTIPRDPWCAAFDAAELRSPLVVRARRSGERFRPFGETGARRLKGVLIDARVPRWERDRLPIVEGGGEVVWLAGLRRSALAPVGSATTRIVELSLSGGEPRRGQSRMPAEDRS
jgi:tRNA(Ile)-lysidine synthase